MTKTTITFFLCIITTFVFAQSLKIVSWNIENLGYLKSLDRVEYIAKVVRDADILAIQEIKKDNGGKIAFFKIKENLELITGKKWYYQLSEPTKGYGSERYGYLWQEGKVMIDGKAWLEPDLSLLIAREPYLLRLKIGNQKILIASIHALPKNKNPYPECEKLSIIPKKYDSDHFVLLGDFNLSHNSPAFDQLKFYGMSATIKNQKTTIKLKPFKDQKFANDYDNIFVETARFKIKEAGIIDFTKDFETLAEARRISDHVPVYVVLELN